MKITDIFEAFDYKANIVWKNDVGYFSVVNQQFKVSVRPATTEEQQTLQPFFDHFSTLNVGNIDFSSINSDGTETQDTTGYVGSNAPKVFAGVAQVVTELQSKHQYDILLAIAKKKQSPTNFDSRVSAYVRIIDFLARRVGLSSLKLVSTPSFVVFAIFNSKLTDGMITIQQHLNDHFF